MSYWVDIQVKFDWDPARTPRDGGSVAGKAVANLLQLLHTYCYDVTSGKPELEIKEWFRQIDQHYRGRLCDLGDFLALAENETRAMMSQLEELSILLGSKQNPLPTTCMRYEMRSHLPGPSKNGGTSLILPTKTLST